MTLTVGVMRNLINLFVAGALLASGAASAQTVKKPKQMVCWTDEKGVRACGNSVPPQYAKGQREVMDKQGRVADVLKREKTPEEVAEAERIARLEAEEKKRKEEQAKYDDFLLATYNSLGQLQRARDDRLITLDGRLLLARKSLADADVALTALRERDQKNEAEGKPDARVKKQIKEFESGRAATAKSIATIERDRGETCSKFGSDMKRFRELKANASSSSISFDCPTAEQLAPPAPELPRAAPAPAKS